MREAHEQVPPAVLAERVRAVLTVDVRPELLGCPVPILYLAATRDRVVPAHNLKQIRCLRPDVRVVLSEGSHLALATNPEPSARAIEAF